LQVDKHIRRLDSDLARFEAEIQDKALSNSRNQDDSVSTKSMVFKFILILKIKTIFTIFAHVPYKLP
jgi:hypothetical protein